jgi:hypothetical protein
MAWLTGGGPTVEIAGHAVRTAKHCPAGVKDDGRSHDDLIALLDVHWLEPETAVHSDGCGDAVVTSAS